MLEIYLDLVVILNFFVDFLLLLGTNRLSGFPSEQGRCALAAVLGALYSGVCLLPGFRFLGNLLWRCVSFGLMTVLAFGADRSAVKRGGIFMLLSLAMGGAAMSLGKGSFPALLLAAGLIWLLCRFGFGGRVGEREYVPVTTSHAGQQVSFLALRDTGNTLHDPITGEQVLVVGADIGQRLTGLSEAQMRSPLETLTKRPISGLRLIPFRTVGQSGGMLLAMRFETVRIGSRECSAIVAFAPEGLGRGDVYQALTGGAL